MGKLSAVIKDQLKKNPIVKSYKAEQRLKQYVYDLLLPQEKVDECNRYPDSKGKTIIEWENDHPEKAAELQEKIDHCISRTGFPGTNKEILDVKFWHYAYGYSPNEYVTYKFPEKNYDERRSFISDRESVWLAYHINDVFQLRLFLDKAKTYARFESFYHRECVTIESDADYAKYCTFVQKHPVFVKKNVLESCGRSVELVDTEKGGISIERLFKELRKTPKLILEELIHQSDAVAVLNPSSVNTVRCFTLKTQKGILVPWTFMKIGRNGSFVDNGGAGGLLVGIDPKTGTFNTDGRDEYGFTFDKHPDTGVTFVGFQLPEWDKMIAICKEMAEMEPSVPWIGWDMTYTDEGWVVVEGNSLSEVIGPQSTYQCGIRLKMDSYIADTHIHHRIKEHNRK